MESNDHAPFIQWRLDSKLKGAYYIKYGTADIDWKKIETHAALSMIAIGCLELPPKLSREEPVLDVRRYKWIKVAI